MFVTFVVEHPTGTSSKRRHQVKRARDDKAIGISVRARLLLVPSDADAVLEDDLQPPSVATERPVLPRLLRLRLEDATGDVGRRPEHLAHHLRRGALPERPVDDVLRRYFAEARDERLSPFVPRLLRGLHGCETRALGTTSELVPDHQRARADERDDAHVDGHRRATERSEEHTS